MITSKQESEKKYSTPEGNQTWKTDSIASASTYQRDYLDKLFSYQTFSWIIGLGSLSNAALIIFLLLQRL